MPVDSDDFNKNIFEPVEGLLCPGLFVLGHDPDQTLQRNVCLEQLAADVGNGSDFFGLKTNVCGVLLATTEPDEVRRRGIVEDAVIRIDNTILAGVTLKAWKISYRDPGYWRQRLPDFNNASRVREWERELLSDDDYKLIILPSWKDVFPAPGPWIREYLGYDPAVTEGGRNFGLDTMEYKLVLQLDQWARERGSAVITSHPLSRSSKGDYNLKGNTNLCEVRQIRLRKLSDRYQFTVPDLKRHGPTRTIYLPWQYDLFQVGNGGLPSEQIGRTAGKAEKRIRVQPVDEKIVSFLTANGGRYTVRQIMEGCGDDWKDRTLRAAYYDALNPQRRRLVPGKVTRYEPDADAGYTEITYEFKR